LLNWPAVAGGPKAAPSNTIGRRRAEGRAE
jgi:hypothetical protein